MSDTGTKRAKSKKEGKKEKENKEWPKGIVIVGKANEEEGVEVGGKDGVRSLGSYVGTPTWTEARILERIDTRAVPLPEFAVSLHHTGAALEVIKRVTAITGLDYILRTTPPELTYTACDYFDRKLRDAFERAVVGCVLSDEEWRRAQLPDPHGYNFVPTRIKAVAAYTTSLLAHRNQIEALSPGSGAYVDKTIASMTSTIKAMLPPGTPFLLKKKMRQGELVRVLLKIQYLEFASTKRKESAFYSRRCPTVTRKRTRVSRLAKVSSWSLMYVRLPFDVLSE